MTDATDGAAEPPKKRFGFKKAAWQTAPKTEAHDMFSHANEFSSIVAAEARRKSEQQKKKKAEEAHKRKLVQEREPKRRKMSASPREPFLGSGLTSSALGDRSTSKRRSKTPLSPTRHGSTSDTLAARYDSLTKSSGSSADATKNSAVISLLSDTEDEGDNVHVPSPSPRSMAMHTRSVSRRDSSEEVEEVDGPHTAAIKAEARRNAAARAAQEEASPTVEASAPAPMPQEPVAIVQLLIDSDIPDTKPLLVKVKSDTPLSRPKEAWCQKQGFTREGMSKVFMTWKNRKIFDYTKIHRLGLQIENGFVTIEDDPTIYDDENLPKIHIEAWTQELWKKRQEEDALEAARAKNSVVEVEESEPEPVPEPEPQNNQVRLILKAKGKADFKIAVRSHTTIEHLTNAYKERSNVPREQPVTLMWDGDRLKPMDTIEDLDIEDMDAIEVHFK